MKKIKIRGTAILLILALLAHGAVIACAEGNGNAKTGNDGLAAMRASADRDDEEDGQDEETEDEDKDTDDEDKDDEDKDDEDKDDEDKDDEEDEKKGSSCPVNPALKFHGPLSAYEPARENVFGPVWGRIAVESGKPDDDSHDGTPRYKAVFEGGKLQQLEVEIELADGTEYEVVYDANRKITRAEYETDDGEMVYDGSSWQDEKGNPADGPDLTFMEAYYHSYKTKGTWYGNNTMSLIGLSLRDMYPALTDTWYQVVPVDLTEEGTFRYATAASNMYYMGSCIVTVEKGNVTVDYTLPEGLVRPESDCLMWFTDIAEITSEFLKAPIGTYEFGKAYSVKDDLKGKDTALLFICNHITFRLPMTSYGSMPVRYYRGKSCVQEKLAEFETLFTRMGQ